MRQDQPRRVRAAELLRRVKHGPAWSSHYFDEKIRERIQESYRIWVDSWVVGDLVDLIPELRKAAKDGD